MFTDPKLFSIVNYKGQLTAAVFILVEVDAFLSAARLTVPPCGDANRGLRTHRRPSLRLFEVLDFYCTFFLLQNHDRIHVVPSQLRHSRSVYFGPLGTILSPLGQLNRPYHVHNLLSSGSRVGTFQSGCSKCGPKHFSLLFSHLLIFRGLAYH